MRNFTNDSLEYYEGGLYGCGWCTYKFSDASDLKLYREWLSNRGDSEKENRTVLNKMDLDWCGLSGLAYLWGYAVKSATDSAFGSNFAEELEHYTDGYRVTEIHMW